MTSELYGQPYFPLVTEKFLPHWLWYSCLQNAMPISKIGLYNNHCTYVEGKMTTGLIHFNHKDDRHLTAWPDLRISTWKPNYGDMLVCAAIIRQLKLDSTKRIAFGENINQSLDKSIIRGSTYLHNEFDFNAANKTLDSLQSPAAIVGLGAQNPQEDLSFLDSNSAAHGFIDRLNEKSKSISVRGNFSAAIVERLGGKNIRVTGCPSLFYSLESPVVTIPEMLTRAERSLGVSLHTGLSKNIFCHSPQKARHLHGQAISFALKNAVNVSLFEQGVMREFNVADSKLIFSQRLESAKAILHDISGEELFSEYDLIAHMVSVKNIEEWLSKARDLDAIIGFRFHGNMVALLQGFPCFYYTYDSRIKEFCDLYYLPSQDVTDDWVNPVNNILDHDWEKSNLNIKNCFDELKSFYSENNFETKFD